MEDQSIEKLLTANNRQDNLNVIILKNGMLK